MDGSLSDLVYDIKNNKASSEFANEYLEAANRFYLLIDSLRTNALKNES